MPSELRRKTTPAFPLTSVSLAVQIGRDAGGRDRVRGGVVALDAYAAVDPGPRSEIEPVEGVQRNGVGAALGEGPGRLNVDAGDRAVDVGVVQVDGIARADAGERRRELLFTGDLQAQAEVVAQPAGRRSRGEARLVREDVVVPLVRLPAEGHEIGRRVVRGGILQCS